MFSRICYAFPVGRARQCQVSGRVATRSRSWRLPLDVDMAPLLAVLLGRGV
jgi:hypothetical protein